MASRHRVFHRMTLAVVLVLMAGLTRGHESGNEGYLEGYAYTGIHEEMLKDTLRTNAYRDGILQNRELFEDKVVVDIGCGTGILSMISAQAGARKVYCIEASSLAKTTAEIVARNNLSHIVTVVNQLAENVVIEEGGCDVIVSEWMGYFLLYENMFGLVMSFRDKWLNKGGIVFPSTVRLHTALYSDTEFWEERVHFWDNLYGYNFKPLKSLMMQEQFIWPERQHLDPRNIVSESQILASIDVYNTTEEEFNRIKSNVKLSPTRSCDTHGVAFWFDALFEGKSIVTLDTSPKAGYNHWSQVIWYFEKPVTISRGEAAEGFFSMVARKEGSFDVEFYLTSPDRVFKSAERQNPDTIFQNLHERLKMEQQFAYKQSLPSTPEWPPVPSHSIPSLTVVELLREWVTPLHVALFALGMTVGRWQVDRQPHMHQS